MKGKWQEERENGQVGSEKGQEGREKGQKGREKEEGREKLQKKHNLKKTVSEMPKKLQRGP